MKKNLLLALLAVLVCRASFAQSNVGTMGFSYSALVRDSIGRVQPSKPVKLRFTLLLGQNGTAAGSPWVEEQNTTTDAYGFVNVTIGSGTRTGGTVNTFSAVDFTITNYWILIEVYNTFTQVYEPLAKQAFQAVPYAKVAGALVGNAIIPSGTIVAFGGDTAHVPAGWILCDGRQLDNTNPIYLPLFNAIGYNWGTSNHANYFNAPNTRGLFLRGAQIGNGYDPDVAGRTAINPGGNVGDNVGSYEGDVLQDHNHNFSIGNFYGNIDGGSQRCAVGCDWYQTRGTTNVVSARVSSETRPRNVYVNYIIKL